MIVGRYHRVGPHVITILQMLPYFFSCHAEGEKQILEAVKFKHIRHCHITGFDGRIKGQRGCQRDVGIGDLQLQVVDQVGKGRVAEETVPGIDRRFETTDLLTDVSLYGIDVLLEVCQHLLVDHLVFHVDDRAFDVLVHHLTVLNSQYDVSLCYILDPAGRIDDEHLLTFLVGNPFVMYLMVVAEEDHVEAWHFSGNGCRRILLIVRGYDTTVLTTME